MFRVVGLGFGLRVEVWGSGLSWRQRNLALESNGAYLTESAYKVVLQKPVLA